MTDIPLGKDSSYPEIYAPEVLAPISRADARDSLGIGSALPFSGVDLWNAWELSWLDPNGKPGIAIAEIQVPADSPNIIESKSLKLYLASFAMTRFSSPTELSDIISTDLSAVAGARVGVQLASGEANGFAVGSLPGSCIDELPADCSAETVDPGLLKTISNTTTDGTLHSHLLRSLCPVTSQPDFGSLLVRYRGPEIDPVSLLQYIVSFRRHNDFHEACVERMFVDIKNRCRCESLDVYARYTRRGGIDINPFRSTTNRSVDNLRLWRQ